MAKVSIIVPTYNVQAYLEDCMDSIIQQTLTDIEIICVNDGSTDQSLDILKKYAEKDDRIVIIDKENEGYGAGMNDGIAKATGEYIGIVEPDDFVPANMYEELYKAAQENDLDFVKADFYRFTGDVKKGNLKKVYYSLDAEKKYYNQVINPRETPAVMKLIMNTWSGIYRRAFLEKYKIRHNTTPGASFQDNGFFWQTFMYAQRCMFIDKPYYMNRRDNPNSSVKSREKVYCINGEYDYVQEIFMREENKELWGTFKEYFYLKRFHNYMATIDRIGEEFKKEYIGHISREYSRLLEAGEIDLSVFSVGETMKLELLVKNPDSFYRAYVITSDSCQISKFQNFKRKILIVIYYFLETRNRGEKEKF